MKPMAPVLSALDQRFSTNPGLLIAVDDSLCVGELDCNQSG